MPETRFVVQPRRAEDRPYGTGRHHRRRRRRFHGRIAWSNWPADKLRVTDLNSTNGTYIDNKRIERSEILAVGSILRVGNVSFEHEVRTRAEMELLERPAQLRFATSFRREARLARS